MWELWMLWLCVLSSLCTIHVLDTLINIDIKHVDNAFLTSLNIRFLANIMEIVTMVSVFSLKQQ